MVYTHNEPGSYVLVLSTFLGVHSRKFVVLLSRLFLLGRTSEFDQLTTLHFFTQREFQES